MGSEERRSADILIGNDRDSSIGDFLSPKRHAHVVFEDGPSKPQAAAEPLRPGSELTGSSNGVIVAPAKAGVQSLPLARTGGDRCGLAALDSRFRAGLSGENYAARYAMHWSRLDNRSSPWPRGIGRCATRAAYNQLLFPGQPCAFAGTTI
jgi:hypothetical protein